MKVGDLVKHKTTGELGVIIQLNDQRDRDWETSSPVLLKTLHILYSFSIRTPKHHSVVSIVL